MKLACQDPLLAKMVCDVPNHDADDGRSFIVTALIRRYTLLTLEWKHIYIICDAAIELLTLTSSWAAPWTLSMATGRLARLYTSAKST